LQAGCVKRRGRSCQLFDKTITHANVHHLIKAMPSILLAPCGVNPGAEAIFWTTEAYDFLIDRSRASTPAASQGIWFRCGAHGARGKKLAPCNRIVGKDLRSAVRNLLII
jgi:hypothetical protein